MAPRVPEEFVRCVLRVDSNPRCSADRTKPGRGDRKVANARTSASAKLATWSSSTTAARAAWTLVTLRSGPATSLTRSNRRRSSSEERCHDTRADSARAKFGSNVPRGEPCSGVRPNAAQAEPCRVSRLVEERFRQGVRQETLCDVARAGSKRRRGLYDCIISVVEREECAATLAAR